MSFGFVLTIILGRYLGAEELGLYRMSTTINGLVILVVAFGIPSAIIKYVAESRESPEKIDAFVSSSVLTSLVIGLAASLLFYLFSGQISAFLGMPDLSKLLITLSLVFPFALVSGVLLGFFNGLRYMKQYSVAMISQGLVTFVLSFLLIYLGYGVGGAILSMVAANILCFIYLLYASRKLFRFTLSGYVTTMRGTLSLGARILLANGINQINYQADIIVIGYFTTAASVGYYSVAVILSTVFWLIPQSIQTITYPAIAEYWSKDDLPAIQTIVDKGIKYSACILFPAGIMVTFFSPLIIATIYGNAFEDAVLPLQILLIGSVINGSIQRPIGSILYAIGMPDLNLKIFSAAAIGNLFLNVLLVPAVGIAGASIATTFSYIFITVFILFYTVKYARIKLDFAYLPGLSLISLVAFVLLSLTRGNYPANIVILSAYLVVIWQRFLTGKDKAYLFNYINGTIMSGVRKNNDNNPGRVQE